MNVYCCKYRVAFISASQTRPYCCCLYGRANIEVPKAQQALALAVLGATKTAGVPTAVVLVHGGALAIDGLNEHATAILDAHYPSETVGAAAVVDALYGKFSPAGKLPYTVMPKAFQNLSNFASMDMTAPPGRYDAFVCCV